MTLRIRTNTGELTVVLRGDAADAAILALAADPGVKKGEYKGLAQYTSMREQKIRVFPELDIWFWTGYTATLETTTPIWIGRQILVTPGRPTRSRTS